MAKADASHRSAPADLPGRTAGPRAPARVAPRHPRRRAIRRRKAAEELLASPKRANPSPAAPPAQTLMPPARWEPAPGGRAPARRQAWTGPPVSPSWAAVGSPPGPQGRRPESQLTRAPWCAATSLRPGACSPPALATAGAAARASPKSREVLRPPSSPSWAPAGIGSAVSPRPATAGQPPRPARTARRLRSPTSG
jgi:hypothetical protein